MNRTFLIFLMIGTALMIMVMGEKPNQSDLDTTPWDINVHDNGNIRIFGITLGKTTLQDANQILASFPETRLIDLNSQPRLVAIYDELNIGGFVAKIELDYGLEDTELSVLKSKVNKDDDGEYGLLEKDTELSLLSKVINKLTYQPSIDYDIDEILQRFGPAKTEVRLSKTLTRMDYPGQGLKIFIDAEGPDRFTYQTLTATTETSSS